MKREPVLLFAFANDLGEGGSYLRNLPEEQRVVQEILEPLQAEGLCQFVIIHNATVDKILDALAKFRDRIAIFHFAGHANSLELLLETRNRGVHNANVKGLADFLAQQLPPELVFLNGCSTQQQATDFFGAGVPCVIATSQSISDAAALIFAERFYKGIAGGRTIRGSFEEAASSVKASLDPSQRHVKLKNRPDESVRFVEERLPWDLYLRPGSEAVAQWNLAEAANDPLFGLAPLPARNLPETPFRHLDWFSAEHAELFFGREFEIRKLYDQVCEPNSAPFLLVYGQSGVGKSSLLAGGLVPRLESSFDVIYCRRSPEAGLLQTASQALAFIKTGPSLRRCAGW